MTDNNRADAVRSAAAAVTATAATAAEAASTVSAAAEKKVKEPRKSLTQIHADKDAARLALAQTLDAIEDRVNLPKKAKHAASNIGSSLRKTGREQPLVLLAIAAGAAGVIGTTVWWLVSRFTRG